MTDQQTILKFLHFGYVPEVLEDIHSRTWSAVKVVERSGTGTPPDKEGLIRRGVRLLKAPFENPGDGPHVVPLSGGLDSRGILGLTVFARAGSYAAIILLLPFREGREIVRDMFTRITGMVSRRAPRVGA